MIKILDCTLRDGGYVNNWNFSDSDISYITQNLIKSKIDIIELGYYDPINGNEYDSTVLSDLENISKRFNFIKKQYVAVMINCNRNIVENLPISSITHIDAIRLAFHKEQISEISLLAEKIQRKGYDVFLQPMATSFFSSVELEKLILISNKISSKALYIVDSFGTMNKKKVNEILTLFDKKLDPKIVIGFHPHNNLQLAYSNTIEFLLNKSFNRSVVIDSSLFGMGRGAGNLNTELIIYDLNNRFENKYNFNYLIDIIETKIKFYKTQFKWGYDVDYLLSGINDCHPNYAKYLVDCDMFSYRQMNDILLNLPETDKRRFNKNVIEKQVNTYNPSLISTEKFKLEGSEVLIIGPGNLTSDNIDVISQTIKSKTLKTISINHKSIIDTDYYFYSNTKRFLEFFSEGDEKKIIITDKVKYDLKLSFGKTIKCDILKTQEYKNAFILFLDYLLLNNFKKVFVAGIDGFMNEINYSYNQYKVGSPKTISIDYQNTKTYLDKIKSQIDIKFLTPSKYSPKKIIGVIPARFSSTRFNGKPLVKINGIEMIKRTYLQVKQSKLLDEVYVATDSNEILHFCQNENINCVMTDKSCLTGTDRIINFVKSHDSDIYINIQGDEPIIDPRCIDELINEINRQPDYDVFNMYKEIESDDEKNSHSIIKVLVNDQNDLMYASRANIPSNKSMSLVKLHKQVCVYGFTKKALGLIEYNQKCLLEKIEDIEILRFIESGVKVKMIKTNFESISVDHPSDILKVENYLKSK